MLDNDNLKVTYMKNLSKQNFNTTVSIPVDNNVNIKTVLEINSYIFDDKVECGSGKAIISGKIGVKVLYIDTDNLTNTMSTTQSFTETFVDSSITTDCFINTCDFSIINSILSSDGILKINCDISLNPIMYLNLGLENKGESYQNMIVKKNEIETCSIKDNISSCFEYTANLETKDEISKILCYNAYFSAQKTTPFDEYVVVEGKIYCKMVYETNVNDTTVIKELSDCFNLKREIDLKNLNDCMLDLSFYIDNSQENISTDNEDGSTIVTIAHKVNVKGVAIKTISMEVVDDLYSAENEITLSYANREFNKIVANNCFETNILGEISIANEEPSVDEVIANMDISSLVTNCYIKNGNLNLEGVITSHIIYLDENKNYQHKQTEIPFVIDSKIELEKLDSVHTNVNIEDCKIKVKRGTIFEIDYSLCVNYCVYEIKKIEMIDNITIGKFIDYSAYDYQIFVAKQGETMWQLCKRIRIAPEEIDKYNKSLPLVMQGGEKIIVKR